MVSTPSARSSSEPSRLAVLKDQRDELRRKLSELQIDLESVEKKILLYEQFEPIPETPSRDTESDVFGPSEAIEHILRSQPTKEWTTRELDQKYREMLSANKAWSDAKNPRSTVRWVLRYLRKVKKIVDARGTRSRMRYKIRSVVDNE